MKKVIALVVLLAACRTPSQVIIPEQPAPQSSHLVVQGTVRYIDNTVPPYPFWVEVELVELLDDGRAGALIAKMMVESPRQMPVPYSLRIHRQNIDLTKNYGLIARVFVPNQTAPIWQNREPQPAIVRGDVRAIDIIVERIVR
ncbi:MAG: YbaY family lipoprotein [Spirochaetaceae bacterium]|nr:YbaY family lipoprotein [Spirochaetaceae bacterium]